LIGAVDVPCCYSIHFENGFLHFKLNACMEPNFKGIYSGDEPRMLKDAYTAIDECNAWDWLKEFNPHPNEGFTLSLDMNLVAVRMKMKYPHTTSTFELTMKIMQDIAKVGWEKHWEKSIRMGTPPCPCRRKRGVPAGWCGVAGGGVPACEH
jgi:hypothetical protein